MKKSIHILSAFLVMAISADAFATLDVSATRGVAKMSFEVHGKAPEACIIPWHMPGFKYRKKDSENEQFLCSLDIGVNAASCAKTNSTNPGVNFFTSKTLTPQEILDKDCATDDVKKEAKYKLSTSCSYTPLLLAYYHVSRALGNISNVPLAVIRTMDLQRHLDFAQQAFSLIPKKTELIYQTWESLNNALKAGRNSKKADLLFVDGYDQSYGALQKNPRGELKYPEFYNGGKDQPERAVNFKKKSPFYKDAITPDLKVGREFNQANVQRFVAMSDAVDMIVMDSILSQQDRFGNIAAEPVFYWAGKKKDGTFTVKTEDDPEDIPASVKSTAFVVNEVMLKDNDCGIVKANTLKDAKLLDKVAHMNPETYKNLLKFAAYMRTPDARRFFKTEILATDDDVDLILANIEDVVELVQKRCNSGDLKLDLDLDLFFSGQELPSSYSCNP